VTGAGGTRHGLDGRPAIRACGVVSSTGRMALMRTVAPATFVEFKRWMATQAKDRPKVRQVRDERQAEIVQWLLD
jgi:hypothetical protein